jgi:ethanolamine utilization protein EutQ
VRTIVTRLVGANGPGANGNGRAATKKPTASVRHVDGRSVVMERFPYDGPEPGQDVFAADVVTSDDGSPVAAGFLTLTRGCFPWTLSYDEVQYVIEGELHIGLPSETVVGRPGDVLFIPKGTAITFGTPSWAKFLYVTFPADWEASLK